MKAFLKILLITQSLFLFTVVQSVGQCELSNLSITNTECNQNELVDVIVDFDYSGEGNQGFAILGNGVNYGNFMYSSLPVTLSEISGNCDTEYEFIVRDVFDPTCSIFTEYGMICCSESCEIDIISATTSECSDDQFSVTLNVAPNSIGSVVDVSINGTVVSQVIIEDTEIIIDNLSSSEAGLNQITLCSTIDDSCCSTAEFLNPCECATINITTEIIDCSSQDSNYFIIVDFDFVSTSDSFQMGGDNNFLGNFAYADLPVVAGPIDWNEEEAEVLIVDKDNFFCFSIANLGIVNDCDIQCQIFNVFAESYDCENGTYFIDLEFETKDITGSTFDVIVDGVDYGSFIYGENFYTVGPINQNCDSAPILIIQDSEDNQCSDFFNFDDPICCSSPCEFTAFEAASICADTEEVIISFAYENIDTSANDLYFVSFNGIEYGPYNSPSGTDSITLSPLADGEYTLTITAESDATCTAETTVIVDCPVVECLITEPFAEAYECDDELFLVDVTFESVGVSDSFEIIGNGQSYGIFSYGAPFYTIGPLMGDCETIYEFIIVDQEDDACSAVYEFEEPICCQVCEIGELEIALIDCQDDLFTISLDFSFEDSGEAFILEYLEDSQTYNYGELPIEIDNLPADTEVVFTVSSVSDTSCTATEMYFLESCLDNVENIALEDIIVTQSMNHIVVDNVSNLDLDLMLVDISGEIIKTSPLSQKSKIYLSKNDLSTGIYLLSFIKNGNVNTKKVFILD